MRVGLIGCGRIAGEAHLPAYARAGVSVSAVCDLDASRAAEFAGRLGCVASTDPVELARRDDVDLLDVATPPAGRAELLRALYSVGKPILSQKPLAYDLATATALVTEADQHGVVLAVNHNARWAPTHQVVYRHILAGDLGRVYAVAHHNRFNEDLDAWYTRHPDYLFLDHGIHYFDLIRVITGLTPVAVSAMAGRAPEHRPAGPVVYSVNLRFAEPDTAHVTLTFVNAVPAPAGFDYRLTVDGTRASALASLTTVDVLPHGAEPRRGIQVDGEWVPDGFAGALTSLIRHLRTGSPLPHSGGDHLASLAVATAAAQSARNHGAWTDVARSEVSHGPTLGDYLL